MQPGELTGVSFVARRPFVNGEFPVDVTLAFTLTHDLSENASVVVEEASDLGVLSNSGLSAKLINEPIGFFSHQEKRGFVPDPS